jgi:2-oxoisovalerate dehydrogenase E2 component (dihydrolipoyl transacylase)
MDIFSWPDPDEDGLEEGLGGLMARYEFKLPDIGEGIAEAEIVAWHVKVGDSIEEDQQIADRMTDKAPVEMESPVSGTVIELAGDVGDQVPIGSVLVVIDTADEVPLGDGAVEPTRAMEEELPTTQVEQPASPAPFVSSEVETRANEEQRLSTKLETNGSHGKILASPAVRRRARDLGIDLTQVRTTGDRIRHSDLDAYLLYNGTTPVDRASAPRQDETAKVVGLRRKIAENMAEAKRRIPHFTLVEEFDVTALEDTRAMMNGDRGGQPKLTLLPFLITAMGKAVAEWPMLNATFDDDAMQLTRHGAMHLGMATQTPGGLMVPVIRNAQAMSVWQIASEVLRLAEAARSGKASRDELSGSTITLSSLGPTGGITSTPVINRPEVAIIAVNKVQEKVVVIDGEIEIRKRMNLSLSCDHRVVDGWDAANFLQAMKTLIENPLRLLAS